MAIPIQCVRCKATMELDDGFRGGVCRCSGCGTLIQVPRSTEEGVARSARPARPEGNGGGDRSADRATGDGGGSSSGFRGPRPVPNVAPTTAPTQAKREATSASASTKQQLTSSISSERTATPERPSPPRPMETVRKNKARLWMGISLIILIVATIVAGVAVYIVTGEPPRILH